MKMTHKTSKKIYVLFGLMVFGVIFSFYGFTQKSAATDNVDVESNINNFDGPYTGQKSIERSTNQGKVKLVLSSSSPYYFVKSSLTSNVIIVGEDASIDCVASYNVDDTITKSISVGKTEILGVVVEYRQISDFSKFGACNVEINRDVQQNSDSGDVTYKNAPGQTMTISHDELVYATKRQYFVTTGGGAVLSYDTVIHNDSMIDITDDIRTSMAWDIPDDLNTKEFTLYILDPSFKRTHAVSFTAPVVADYQCPQIDKVTWTCEPEYKYGNAYYFSENTFNKYPDGATLATVNYSDNVNVVSRTFPDVAGVKWEWDTAEDEVSEESMVNTDASSNTIAKAGSARLVVNPNKDGTYNPIVQLKDAYGNETTYSPTIIYDTSKPVIEGVKLNNVAYSESKKLFNEEVTVGFEVTDMCLANVDVYVGKDKQDDLIAEDDSHFSFMLTDEVKGKIKIVATDAVGHENVYESSDDIEIDTTPLDVTSAIMNDIDILNNDNSYMATNACNFAIVPDNTDVKKITVDATIGEGESATTHSIELTESKRSYVGALELPDGDYEFSVNLEDKAGNTSTVLLKKFTVDTTAPTLICTQDKNVFNFTLVEKNLNDGNIGNATIACQDLFKSIEDITVKINDKEASGSLAIIQSLLVQSSNWKAVEGLSETYSLTFEVVTNGTYDFSVELEDLAGNHSEKLTNHICHDTKEPDLISASFDVEKREFKDYGYIANKTIGLEIVGLDEVSGIKAVCVNYKDINKKEIKGDCVLKEGTADTYLYFFGKNECEKGIIETITLTDNNDNTRVVDFKNGVIIDKETADVELLNLEISDNVNGRAVLNEDLDLTLSIKDNYSGIGSYNYILNGMRKDGAGNKHTIEYEKVIKDKIIASENEGDDIVVEFSATDNAGNSRKIEKKYSFDTTKPTIKVSYDSTTDNNYYKVTRTATVTITDEHFDEKGVIFAIANNGNKVDVSPKFSTNDGKTFTASVPFSEEGIYTVGLTATDRAGNQAVFTDSTLFTVDKTAPKLSISYDDTRALNGKYFNKTRVATVLVDELNFDDSSVKVNVNASEGGRTPQLSSFSNSLTHHTANLSFSVDGNYTVTASVTDKAGNVSEEVTSPEFVIDTKQPEISFNGVEEGRSYNGDIAPACAITDVNYDSGEIEASGVKYGKHNELSVSNNKTKEGETFTYSVFAKQLGTDDAYTVRATARDLAGNTQEKSISFKVNRFGSRYSLDEYTTEAVEKYYVNSDKNFVIIEDNLDKVSNYELCYVSDGATKVLDYEKNYTVSSSVDGTGWNTYSYSIKPDMLEKDGVYSFVVYSTDAAGNKSDNITKGTPLQVCVDDTAPVITVTNLEDTGVYRVTDMKAKVIVTDNIAYDKSIIKLNNDEYEVTDSDFDIDIKESKEEQTLEIMAVDKAGNIVSTDIYTFLVDSTASENAKVESRRTGKKSIPTPIIVICVILGVCAVGSAITFIVYALKKRKNPEE